MASTDLVPVNGDLAEAEAGQLAAAIAELGAQGDAVRLKEVSEEIDARVAAWAVYRRRGDVIDAMGRGMWLRCLAEAELGSIHLRGDWPEDLAISRPEVVYWRALAIAQKRGVFDAIVRDAIREERFSGRALHPLIVDRGVLGVPRGALQKAFERSPLSMAEVHRRSGKSYNTLVSLVKNPSETTTATRRSTIQWLVAARVAEVLNVEPTMLPLARRKHATGRRRRGWVHRQRKLTGGRWDDSYVRFRAALDAFAKVAGEAAIWDEAYEHWYALERTIAGAMKREAYGK